ncbi:MAG TPA: tetratricopeptide repeat protein [Burkholderiaceae bacterium]|jgi:tetratricopeptide (TPR) repeat protein|nr:tetratricopeptide repeat protein [Burkholderiaceae bacterium]
MQTFTLSSIQSMLGLSRSVISGLIAAGFVTPTRGKRQEYRFSFQDVVLLRTAYSLQAANIPPRKILRSLQRLKATLPEELPLSGLRIAAVGSEIAVREGDKHWNAESGQLLMDFEVKPAKGSVSFLSRSEPTVTAPEHFERALKLEAEDPRGAEAAYREAIALAPDYLDAYLNLGVLLCDAGRPADAVTLYHGALKQQPHAPLLHFNLAIALEDLQRLDDALASYEACLKIDGAMADAHFNAARLHEQLGHATKAIRHYSAYRRLNK